MENRILDLEGLMDIFYKEINKPAKDKTKYHLERIKEAYGIYQEKYKALTGHFYKPKV